MKNMLVILLGIFISSQTYAGELEQYKLIAATSLAEADAFDQDNWRMKRISKDGETIKHEIFDPKRSPPWQLTRINGQKPSEEQRKEYDEKQVDGSDEKMQKLSSDKLSYMVPIETLAIVDNQEQQATLSFTPRVSSLDEDQRKNLQGVLILDLMESSLKSIEIKNTSDLSPNFFVTFERFSLSMEFKEQGQHLVMHKMISTIQGRTGLFASINHNLEQVYSDFFFLINRASHRNNDVERIVQ